MKLHDSFNSKLTIRLSVIITWGTAVLLMLAPFYPLISVSLASHFHHLDLFKIGEEIILAALGLVMVYVAIANRQRTRRILKDKLLLLMGAYGLLIVLTAAYDLLTQHVGRNAVVFGLILDLRPLAIFALVFLARRLGVLKKDFPWRRLILIPAAVVIVFGLLQFSVLPKNFLTHFGYSSHTIVPYQTVDNQPNFVRLQASLRGPDPLGAYLVVPITLAIALIFSAPRKIRWYLGGLAAAGLVVLYGTYSRSAWVGLVLSLGILLLISGRTLLKRYAVWVGAALAILVLITVGFAGTYRIENILFHSSYKSHSAQSSNAQRASALRQGLHDVVHHPLGTGVGSAGPASVRNSKGPARIAENYFIQVGQELGLIGLALFVLITVVIAVRLWRRRHDPLSLALLASLLGLVFINMVSHAWADDTLAYVWWGLAGLALGSPVAILKPATPHETL